MRKRSLSLFALALLAIHLILVTSKCLAQAENASATQEEPLRQFLMRYVLPTGSNEETTSKYLSAFVDLKDDGSHQVIVYFTSNDWCGSGGCTMLVLSPEGSSLKVITRTTITRPPIRVLASKSNGWHDISVWVQGGGIMLGYEAKLSFNGKRYPGNPSVYPATKIKGKVEGRLVISGTEEEKTLH